MWPAESNLGNFEKCLFITAVSEMYIIINWPAPVGNRREWRRFLRVKSFTTGTQLTLYKQWVLKIGNLLYGAKWFPAGQDEVNLSHHWYNKNNNIISICFHSLLDRILFIYPINFKAPMHIVHTVRSTFRRIQMEYFARMKG